MLFHLWQIRPLRQDAQTVHRMISVQHDFTEREVGLALEFLAGLENAEFQTDEFGPGKTYKITSKGVLAYVRSRSQV